MTNFKKLPFFFSNFQNLALFLKTFLKVDNKTNKSINESGVSKFNF